MLPGLGGGMVNFEDAKPLTPGTAIGISVQSRPQHNDLTHPAFHSSRNGILREARPNGDENPHPSSRGSLRSFASYSLGVFTQDAQSQWIRENAPLFEDLMRGTVSGSGPGRPAWLSPLHPNSIYESLSTKVYPPIAYGKDPFPQISQITQMKSQQGKKCGAKGAVVVAPFQ